MKSRFIFLGLSDYDYFLERQKVLTDRKFKGLDKNNYVIITEHYPIYTLGKRVNTKDLPKKDLAPIKKLDRGGGITFHGFGQIVVYPIINLKDYKLSLKEYISILEEVIIKSLSYIGIDGYRKDNLVGVFTEKGKIAFIGVKVSKFITNFGFSVNYNVDKNYFYNINPCGLKNEKIANIKDYKDIKKEEFLNTLYRNLKEVF